VGPKALVEEDLFHLAHRYRSIYSLPFPQLLLHLQSPSFLDSLGYQEVAKVFEYKSLGLPHPMPGTSAVQ
jgi:hypothetical protein